MSARARRPLIGPALLLLTGLLAGCGLGAVSPPPTATAPPAATLTAAAPTPSFTAPAAPSLSPSPLRPEPTATASPTTPPTATPTEPPTATPTEVQPVVFAVIGDYGSGHASQAAVAALILGWSPDFIVTTGDNNYPAGAADTIDQNVGQFFHSYIHPYRGGYGEGAETNRFFPILGNHDLEIEYGQAYLDYFELPGNERYYDFAWGPVHLFALNSDWREPDGVTPDSAQGRWLQERLAASGAPWKLVLTHVSPYSSGFHGSAEWMRWPFQEWGASAVLAGHDHTYERIELDGLPYFVNGLGGQGRYPFEQPVEGSSMRFNRDYGAMRVEATEDRIVFQFVTIEGEVIDLYTLER